MQVCLIIPSLSENTGRFNPIQYNATTYTPFWASDWGSKVPQNETFPAQDANEPPCKNLMPLALSLAQKCVTVQTQNYKQAKEQTVNDISILCLSACVDTG